LLEVTGLFATHFDSSYSTKRCRHTEPSDAQTAQSDNARGRSYEHFDHNHVRCGVLVRNEQREIVGAQGVVLC